MAIVGLAMRLPGGITSPERFWKALADRRRSHRNSATRTMGCPRVSGPDPDHPGTMYDSHGGFLSDIDAFDADVLWNPSPRSGEHGSAAAHTTGTHLGGTGARQIDPRSLMNTQTGVFLGLTNSDYGRPDAWMTPRRSTVMPEWALHEHRSRTYCLFSRYTRACSGHRYGMLIIAGCGASGGAESAARAR